MEHKSLNHTLADTIGIDASHITKLNQAFAQAITQCASAMDSISIPGFGTFNTVRHTERIVQTDDGSRHLEPPSIQLTFRSSIILRKKLAK